MAVRSVQPGVPVIAVLRHLACSLIHLFNKCLSNTHCVPGTLSRCWGEKSEQNGKDSLPSWSWHSSKHKGSLNTWCLLSFYKENWSCWASAMCFDIAVSDTEALWKCGSRNLQGASNLGRLKCVDVGVSRCGRESWLTGRVILGVWVAAILLCPDQASLVTQGSLSLSTFLMLCPRQTLPISQNLHSHWAPLCTWVHYLWGEDNNSTYLIYFFFKD